LFGQLDKKAIVKTAQYHMRLCELEVDTVSVISMNTVLRKKGVGPVADAKNLSNRDALAKEWQLWNAGAWGGKANTVINVLKCMIRALKSKTSRRNCNMAAFNVCLLYLHRTKLESPMDESGGISNLWKKDCRSTGAAMVHDKCKGVGNVCLVIKDSILAYSEAQNRSQCESQMDPQIFKRGDVEWLRQYHTTASFPGSTDVVAGVVNETKKTKNFRASS